MSTSWGSLLGGVLFLIARVSFLVFACSTVFDFIPTVVWIALGVALVAEALAVIIAQECHSHRRSKP